MSSGYLLTGRDTIVRFEAAGTLLLVAVPTARRNAGEVGGHQVSASARVSGNVDGGAKWSRTMLFGFFLGQSSKLDLDQVAVRRDRVNSPGVRREGVIARTDCQKMRAGACGWFLSKSSPGTGAMTLLRRATWLRQCLTVSGATE